MCPRDDSAWLLRFRKSRRHFGLFIMLISLTRRIAYINTARTVFVVVQWKNLGMQGDMRSFSYKIIQEKRAIIDITNVYFIDETNVKHAKICKLRY